MPSKNSTHEVDSVQPGHARPAKSQAPKQQGSAATGQRGDAPDNKPDRAVVEHSQRTKEHIDEHRSELAAQGESDSAPAEDAEHGYSQDAGYAQSAGNAPDAPSRTERKQDRKQ